MIYNQLLHNINTCHYNFVYFITFTLSFNIKDNKIKLLIVMETLWRKIWGYTNDHVVCPGTGLTGREIKLVQSTWAIVKKDPVASGIAIMSCFFERYPEYQAFFPAFKDVPREELSGNKRFQAHAASVIGGLNSIIDALTDGGLLEATLVTLGERHGKRGQTSKQFLHLKEVVLYILRQSLGGKFTSETEDAWTKTLDTAYTHIFKGLSS